MTTWFVSRHPGAMDWAEQQNLRVDRHIAHLDPAQVEQGDAVIGTLPVHLAYKVCQRGARYINLSLDMPAQWRGRELSAQDLQACNARLESFTITRNPI